MKKIFLIFTAVLVFTYAAIDAGGLFVNHAEAATTATPAPQSSAALPSPSPPPAQKNPFTELFSSDASETSPGDTWYGLTFKVVIRLLLAVVLSAILAFRPRRNIPLLQRNIYVSQTQILLAVVGAALMMIVGDSAGRAFAIFAAVSLVRFRTNIRDPKEITVLVISLALGLAAGVGRWELGVVLCLFSLVLLWVLEYNEPEQVFRSMELKIRTRNPDRTQTILQRILQKYKIEGEVREIEPPDEKKLGSVSIYLNLPVSISTSRLNERIFALDGDDIEGVEWQQKKNGASVYQ